MLPISINGSSKMPLFAQSKYVYWANDLYIHIEAVEGHGIGNFAYDYDGMWQCVRTNKYIYINRYLQVSAVV